MNCRLSGFSMISDVSSLYCLVVYKTIRATFRPHVGARFGHPGVTLGCGSTRLRGSIGVLQSRTCGRTFHCVDMCRLPKVTIT